ncbi:hypothetical protein PENTCL1PPCAC_17242, partial [Pristionchus entomophagus]
SRSFSVLSGSICYTGTEPMLTQTSSDGACNTPCPGSSSSKCGNNENVRLYLYPYVDEATQCTSTSCGPAITGYCVEQNNSFSCVCRPGTEGNNCQTTLNPCSNFGCLNGGQCLPTEDSSAARCICKTGYSGPYCANVDRCYFAPCKNGGSCANTVSSWADSLVRASGGGGDPISGFKACSSSPCAHGSKCVDVASGIYDCECTDGWEGKDCDIDIDECAMAAAETPRPEILCENGGTCLNTLGSYQCSCINGTEGFDCSINPDDCNMTYTGPDGNNYTNLCIYLDKEAECEDGFATYTCKCSEGYKGEYCMDDVDECSDAAAAGEVICENFGTCVNTIGSYHCNCIFGTFGFNCSINPDDCAISNVTIDGKDYPNECIARDKRANCTDGFGTYYCECSQYWTGPHCLTDVDECLFVPQPCVNFGSCNNTPGYYECFCINGTEGHDCEINPDDCVNVTACNTADAKANCTDGFASFTCTCSPDYTMKYCDLEMIIYNVLQLIGGGGSNEAELIAMLRDLLRNPSMMKDLIPFVIGLQSKDNRTKMSWDVEDLFLWISYEERTLDLRKDLIGWNDVVLGNCFTFNHFNNTERSYLMRSDGAQGGLKAALKLNSDEYVPWTETTAIMTFIHPNTETIFSESPRYNAEPSAMTTIQSRESRYQRLGGRYGKCVTSADQVASYYYEGSYTTDGCLRSCYQDQVKKECGCMDSRYPISEKETACELPDRKCVDKITAKGDVSTWAGCVCPLPCENSQFDSSYSVAPFVRNRNKCNTYTAEQRLNNSCCDDLNGQVDYLILNVQVPRIVINIFKEDPAWTFNRVIGNIGGLGGVVCGLNLITFFEFGFFFFFQLPMTILQKFFTFPMEDGALLISYCDNSLMTRAHTITKFNDYESQDIFYGVSPNSSGDKLKLGEMKFNEPNMEFKHVHTIDDVIRFVISDSCPFYIHRNEEGTLHLFRFDENHKKAEWRKIDIEFTGLKDFFVYKNFIYCLYHDPVKDTSSIDRYDLEIGKVEYIARNERTCCRNFLFDKHKERVLMLSNRTLLLIDHASLQVDTIEADFPYRPFYRLLSITEEGELTLSSKRALTELWTARITEMRRERQNPCGKSLNEGESTSGNYDDRIRQLELRFAALEREVEYEKEKKAVANYLNDIE